MNHKECKELLPLSIYGDMTDEERKQLGDHVAGCGECRGELEQLKKFYSVVGQHRRLAMSNQLLSDARRRLRVALQEQTSRPPLWERLIEPIYKISFGGIGMLAVGFIAGYVTFSGSGAGTIFGQTEDAVPVMEGGTQISNVRFLDSDAADGEVEFTFDAVRPVRIKGKMADPQVQKILAHALLDENNPGLRIRSASALAESPGLVQSKELRESLLRAVTSDPNPSVRRDALGLIQRLPFDSEIKDALLYVLQNDENAGVRIVAINGLEKFKDQASMKDAEVVKVLQEKTKMDENNYIRLMARNVLEEIKPQ